MPIDSIGTIGTLNVRLAPAEPPDRRYSRRYVPVTPASREIPGSDNAVAPDTTIANWRMEDWAAGEGDRRWKDRNRYYQSTGLHPADDGSGIVLGFAYSDTQYGTGGSGDFGQGSALGRGGDGKLLAAEDMDGNLWIWDTINEDWDQSWSMSGGGSDNANRIASPAPDDVYVLDNNNDIEKVTSGSSTAWNTTKLTGCYDIVAYDGLLYALGNDSSTLTANLWLYDQSSANTATQKSSEAGELFNLFTFTKMMTTSDVGPCWFANLSNGQTLIYEYNVDDDVTYKVGELPPDVYAHDIAFFAGIYFVVYRQAVDTGTIGKTYLYYNAPQGEGVVGPIGTSTQTAAGNTSLPGVIGDRLYITTEDDLWAYNLSTGGISQVATGFAGTNTILFSDVFVLGRDIFIADSQNDKVYQIETDEYDTSSGQTLDTGLFDFGYLGLKKTLTRVTASLEAAVTDPDLVEISYAVDGGAFTALTADMENSDGTSKTWTVSNNSSTIRGTEFELQVAIDGASSTRTPKLVALDAEAVGSEDRLELVLMVDLSDKGNPDTGGQAILDGLKTLKTNHAVVQVTDPWDSLSTEAAETVDMTVEEVVLPASFMKGFEFATVRLRSVVPV